jgi:cholera toxin transcriptional activator
MTDPQPAARYRFGVFEADSATGELRRKGMRVKLHAQPFQVLFLLLERPGEMLTREEICRELWPEGTFVDYEHGVNSAVNRLREALGDKASNPKFVETLARRGYRFLAPVERISPEPAEAVQVATTSALLVAPITDELPAVTVERSSGVLGRLLAAPEDLPKSSHATAHTLFLLLQAMYLSFYIGALANLPEINELVSPLRLAAQTFTVLILTAALLIPVRIFLSCAVLFRAPRLGEVFGKLWWFLLPLDALWSLSPFLLLHHINYGLALACTTILIYSPFAQRSLILMGAGRRLSST